MSQDSWAQFANAVKKRAQASGGAPRPPKGLFAGVGGLAILGFGGLVFATSLFNGMYLPLTFCSPTQCLTFPSSRWWSSCDYLF